MARFDPHSYPDRLALHAHARRLRNEEFSRLAAEVRTWLAHVGTGFAIPRFRPAEFVRRGARH